MATKVEHPTKERLISTVVQLLDHHSVESLTNAEVLKAAGISSGSLYHFFEGLSDLVEQALIRRFSAGVIAATAAILRVVEEADSREAYLAGLAKITKGTQNRAMKSLRLERARLLAMSQSNPRMEARVREVQQKLTDDLTQTVEVAQAKGLASKAFQPRTIAVFIQAYTLGRVVDDFVDTPMDDADWANLIDEILMTALSA